MNNSKKNDYNIKMSAIKTIWKNDTDKNKPKKLFFKDGRPTKKGIEYNRRLIREGLTTEYIVRGKAYNPTTFKEIDLLTKTGRKKKITKFDIYKGVAVAKKTPNVDRTFFMEQGLDQPQFTGDSLLNDYLLERLAIDLEGEYRIVILKNGNVISDSKRDFYDGWFNEGFFAYSVGGTPPKMIWNGIQTSIGDSQYLPEGTKIRFVITKENRLPTQFYEQRYKHGLTNCLLTPIKNWFRKRVDEIKTKKTRLEYQRKTNLLTDLIENTKDGVSHTMIENICNTLQIAIKLIKPFSKEVYFEALSMKKPIKQFTFLNSIIDHVDALDNEILPTDSKYIRTFDPEIKTRDELKIILKELIQKNQFYVFEKDTYGIKGLRTLTNYYKIDDTFNKICSDFEKESGLEYVAFDALRYPDLADHINKATHFNGTIDFKDTSHLREIGKGDIKPDNVEHIDMEKAYANFFRTDYYKGFMGNIQIWRKTSTDKHIGLYHITNLDWTKANEKFKELNDTMQIYFDNNVYSKPELDLLRNNGVIFTITHGCYSLEPFDFKFNEDMIKKTDETRIDNVLICKVKYYAKFCGKLASSNTHQSFYMKGNNKLLGTITQNENLKILTNDYDNETRISYKKQHLPTKKHITAQIIAYQRIMMIEQLMQMDLNKILRVCVDGIYYEPHKFTLKGVFREKNDEMTFKNYPATEYISNIIDNGYKPNHNFENLGIEREDYEHELHSGAGGTGKTYYNLIIDKGLIHPIYIALSWKLSTDMAKSYKEITGKHLHNTVLHQILEDKGDGLQQKYGNYIIDECSMLTEQMKDRLLDILPKTIFMGDLHAQLLPVIGQDTLKSLMKKLALKSVSKIPEKYLIQMNANGFDYIKEYTKSYRFNEGDKINDLAEYLRKNIYKYGQPIWGFKKNYGLKIIGRYDVAKFYNHKEDMILGADKHSHKYFKDEFKHLEKYKVLTNFTQYKNGEIVYEKISGVKMEHRHSFTVHSVQGLTFKGKIFIDMKNLKCSKMFYTAISRAKSIEQIYIVI